MPRNKTLLKGSHGAANHARKITIRPYSKPPTLPPNYYETTSQPLLESILSVITKKAPPISLQNAYTAVVHLCSHQFGPRLYDDLFRTMRQAAAIVLPEDDHIQSRLLDAIPGRYQTFMDFLLLTKHVFLTLDRTHSWNIETNAAVLTKGHTASPIYRSLWQLGLSCFASRMAELKIDTGLYQEWLNALLQDWNPNQANHSSNNNNTNGIHQRQALQQVWYMWQDLGLLGSLPLQTDLEHYWSQQASQWAQTTPYPASAFLAFASSKHAHVSSWPWLPSQYLWSILEHCLVQPHLKNPELLLHSNHFYPLMTQAVFAKETTSIQQLWMLASRLVAGTPMVVAAIQRYAKDQGMVLVKKETNIADLLHLQASLQQMIRALPNNNNELISLKNVWEDVVNIDTTPPVAEALAKFLDSILRSNKKMDQYQLNNNDPNRNWVVPIISGIFVPLQAKDVFEAFYKRDLAKRLLWNRVVSMDVEKQVCSLLKAECGADFTSKMEGMFHDVVWSRETMLLYKQSMANTESTKDDVDMEVQVLTTGYWPVYPQYPTLNLPESLRHPQEQFMNYYKSKYQGRCINWQYALGHCIVKCTGWPKTYELVVSLIQALTLLQFNNSSRLTLPTIMQAIGLEDRDEMERILQSLALGKEGTRVLRKLDYDAEPKKKIRMTIDDRDRFEMNERFESNQRRIRINNILMKETKEDRDKAMEAVSRDRLYLIDAVLVRIMKARKTILHQSLIPQVLEQLKVPAQPADIKKRIESLIEREYMERDAKDRNRYNYLA